MTEPTLAARHLEDFTIGDRIRTGSIHITEAMSVDFAQTYDPQPIHVDAEAARDSIFGGLVTSGWQTLALTMRLIADAKPLGATPLIGIEVQNLRFLHPVRPGDTLTVEAEVLGSRRSESRPERGFLDMAVTTRNQEGRPVVTQRWTLLVPTRDTAS
ncbi:MAG TPA: MaoC family dehydratase [Methylomirabilota bacterium]|nr:MaoC family dehydratase [Methylomirabilota bacterium]